MIYRNSGDLYALVKKFLSMWYVMSTGTYTR